MALYECVECNHKISDDAWRCPNCGCKDAGKLAESSYTRKMEYLLNEQRDKAEPGWREREAKEAQERSKAYALKRLADEKAKKQFAAWRKFWSIYPTYIIPTIVCISIFAKMGGAISAYAIAFIPVFNWIVILRVAFASQVDYSIFETMIALAVVGVVFYFVTMSKESSVE